ncbi:hypothetical protein CF60_09070 [Escherichia coli]|nr:hypothetical protein CF60_09070 [Escherichia coli]
MNVTSAQNSLAQNASRWEGGDALIPMLKEMIRHAGNSGTREVVLGMAHRGRLNVLGERAG